MIPPDITAPQLAWHVLAGGNLAPVAQGCCRICGGRLVGKAQLFAPSQNWMGEHQCACKDSDRICGGCAWVLRNRGVLSLTMRRARLISPTVGCKDYGDDMIPELITDMRRGFPPPYLFFLRERRSPYKNHLLFEAAVSWGNPGYVTFVTADDNFSVPLDLTELAAAIEILAGSHKAGRRLRLPQADPFWRTAELLASLEGRRRSGGT